MENIEALKNLGLSENEARIYLSLLQMGKTTAYVVADNSGIKRSTTYGILEQLVGKGFVQRIPRAKKRLYQAEPPKKCLAMAREKLDLAQKELPKLEALTRGAKSKVNVSYYEGIRGVREIYERMLKEMRGQEVLGFVGSEKNAPEALLEYWAELNEKRKKTGVKGRAIMPEDSTTQPWLEKQKEYLFNLQPIPSQDYDSDISIEVYKDTVQIISFRYLQGVVIENPDVAHAVRQIFEMNWKLLRKNTDKSAEAM